MPTNLQSTNAEIRHSRPIEIGGAAKRGQGQAAADPSGPRPDAGGSLVRGAEQQRRSRPARGARRALRRDSAGRPQPTVRTWGAKPRAPAKRGYPPVSFCSAEVRPEGPQAIASSDGGKAPSAALAAGRCEASPHRRVAALRAAPPRAARSAALEPEGREVIAYLTGVASSRDSDGAAALAAVPEARPARWQVGDESAQSGIHRIVFAIVPACVSPRRRVDEPEHERNDQCR